MDTPLPNDTANQPSDQTPNATTPEDDLPLSTLLGEEDDIPPDVQVFLLSAVGLSVAAWDLSFNLGVYETIFFSKFFFVWVACSAVLLASLALPTARRPFGGWRLFTLLIPTLWLVVSALVPADTRQWAPLVTVIVIITQILTLASFPYILYTVLLIVQAEMLLVPRRMLVSLVLITLVIGMVGFVVGANHNYFVQCYDFRVSGNYEPPDCIDWLPTEQPASAD
ncbi:MAG: hypothetical protein GYB67_17465 [Chloroflexi bacterium]|nr:hypothetical protein [Chloroflexota bacterium]